MNEQFFLKFYVALNNCKKEESLHQQTFLLFHVLYILLEFYFFTFCRFCYGSCEDDQRHEVWNYHQAVKEV